MTFLKKQLLNQFWIVSLNRPERKNAFHPEMIQELTQFFLNITHDKNAKGIILQGEGTAFSSGADLNWMQDMVNYSHEENVLDSERLWEMFEAMYNCEIPIIGKIHGAVFGGAIGLVACCDYVFAEEKSSFCFSEVKLGLIPAVISGFILKKCSEAQTFPYMLSGEVFGFERAHLMGLVQEKFQTEITLERIIEKFSLNGTQAMRELKKLARIAHNDTVSAGYKAMATQAISERRTSLEAQSRLKNFLEKSLKK